MSSTHIMRTVLPAAALALSLGCGSGSESPTPDAPQPDALSMCDPARASLTYTELYTRYFAAGTRGNCATEDCHGDTSYNLWSCGSNKDKCFSGMANYGLINTRTPLSSRLGDPGSSPLRWFNVNGPMPADNPTPFDEGRDAIAAWIAACAPNN
jgi:hypothetical protein